MVDNHAWLFFKVAFATGPTLASLLNISTKLTTKEAVEIIPVLEFSLRKGIKSGKVSSEKDPQGRRQIDVSELSRVYRV